ncbi:MAG: DMT family transporter [Alteromonadaceae bacterium]|nr:DMT family transporter [Alteromonadaceae bacterium]
MLAKRIPLNLILLTLVAVTLMGFVPVLVKWTNANETTIGIARLVIGTLGTLTLLASAKSLSTLTSITKKDWLWLALMGLVFAVHWYSYFLAINIASVSFAVIGVSTYGIHLLLLNRFFFKETIKPSEFSAIILAFTGVLIAAPSLNFDSNAFVGFSYGLISGFLYGLLSIMHKKTNHLPTHHRALGQFGFALICFSLFWTSSNWQLNTADWVNLLVLGVVCTLVAHTLWIKVSTELPANLTAILYYIYLPVAMGLSVLILDEVLSWQKLLGAGIIVSANIIIILMQSRKLPEPITSTKN